jgi:hypothetical protein
MMKARSFDIWLHQVLRFARRARNPTVRAVANMQTHFWRDRWREGLSPRAAYRRHRQCWE